ncbi:MAG: DUF4287 domain-containing protein [Acidobacteria bacterium]|nr:DUF4287 domain-containing protein [Acidobacteriota bacterium]
MAERMSDEAVQSRTGKTWDEWFAILDAAGCREMDHQQVVAWLSGQPGVGPWWQQMVTVTYERARGKRVKHETPAGFQVSGSRTIAVPVSRLFAAWTDEALRQRWLPDADFTVRKATPDKSLRIAWGDGTNAEVNFYPKGEAKSQVAVDHKKLPDAQEAARRKAWWSEALDRLRETLETKA